MGGQVALALVLLVASGLMVRSFQKLRAVDPGFNPASTLTFRLGLPAKRYPTRAAAVAAHRAFLDRLSAIPGVTAVSASTCLPLRGGCFGNTLYVEGRTRRENTAANIAWLRAVSGGYVEAMGMRLLRGRTIDRHDVDRGEPVVTVNKAFADVFFPNQDAIGQRIRSSTPPTSRLATPPWLTIVGIVSNTSTVALAESAPAVQLFMPMSIAGGPDIPAETLLGPSVTDMSYVVRAAIAPSELAPAIRRAISQVDANVAVAELGTLQDTVDRAAAQTAFTMALIVIAALVALMLGVVGIYGVIAYIVSQRTSEIGVRLALGADPGTIVALILRQGGLVTVAGAAVGFAATLAGSRWLASLLYGVSPRDPAVFGATTLLLLTVALVACWIPARRAARVSPLEALRAE
jgi:putative ABC transport system permease protein